MIWDLLKNFVTCLSCVKVEEEISLEGAMDNKNVTDTKITNGLALCGSLIPVERLSSILKWVDEDTLVFSCRLVCKEWMSVVDQFALEEKTNCTNKLLGRRSSCRVPWWVAHPLAKSDPFNKNLIKNNCGEDYFEHWMIKDNFGDRWKLEREPQCDVDPLPKCEEIGNKKSYFVTTFEWCSKEQTIRLDRFGLTDKIMDEIQPDFKCSEWICARFDCGGMYYMQIMLLDVDGNPIGEPVALSHTQEDVGWVKVETTLSGPYPPGARYIKFFHKGKDTKWWKGHYGIKMIGSCVRPIFPKERFLKKSKHL